MYAALTFFGNGKLICKSSSAADNGKTVSVTDGKKSWSAIMTDGVCTFTIPGKQKYTVCLLNGDNAEYVTEVFFGFGECKELEVGMDKTTWKGLKAILNAGLETEMLAVGDQISATVAGEEQVFDIVHIDYRTNLYGKNLILAKHSALSETRQMQGAATNVGGYKATKVASYLDDTYYNSLPADMKSVITKMTFQASAGNTAAILQNEEHMIWCPLEYNIFGFAGNSLAYEYAADSGGAQLFDYFNSQANRIKTLGNTGSALNWWCSSAQHSARTHYCAVTSTGTIGVHGADASIGVVPFFMIAADAE